jgi:hypothetical protein
MTRYFSKWLLLCFLSVSFLASNLYAGSEGHGGTGIWVNGHLYLMDLHDNGLDGSAVIDRKLLPRQDYLERISTALKPIFPQGGKEVRLVAQKITEIGNISSAMAETLVQGMLLYSWSMPADGLKNSHDDNSPLVHSDGHKVQLALRTGRSIKFSGELVPLLPIEHRVALVFHEIAYAFTEPASIGDGWLQNSSRAKDFTGFIFSKILRNENAQGLFSMAKPMNLPTWKISLIRYDQFSTFPSFFTNPSLRLSTFDSNDNYEARITPDSKFGCIGGSCVGSTIEEWCSAIQGRPYGPQFIFVQFSAQKIEIEFESYDEYSSTIELNSKEYLHVWAHEVDGSKAGGDEEKGFDSECLKMATTGLQKSQSTFAKYFVY